MPPELSPLENPAYDPVYKPVAGAAPMVVAKWGPRSQLRWFDRFRDQLQPRPAIHWGQFYCSSLRHKGNCCSSCIEDQLEGYDDWSLDHCCCRAYRAEDFKL